MAKSPGKNGNCNVVQDSSLIRLPDESPNLEAIATLSQAEAAFPHGDKKSDEYIPSTPLKTSDDEYHMAHRFRGKVIIFNHLEYDTNLELLKRLGTDLDRNDLEETFKKMEFSVQINNDPTRAEILETLRTESANKMLYSADCLVVVVLTHGGENNCLYAKDTEYNVSELWTPFLADQCPYLATKPKIFIIQACRGDEASRKVEINPRGQTITTDTTKVGAGEAHGENFSIPAEADILIAFSSFEGRVAHRDIVKGTWYINELCKELKLNWQNDDLMTMLTRVNRNVAFQKECNMYKQMPSIQSTLTRKIYFQNNKRESNGKEFRDLMSKVDRLITLHEGNRTRTTSCQSTSAELRRDRDIAKEIGSWNDLRSDLEASYDMPNEENVLQVSKGLRLFLKDEGRKLKDETNEDGCMILALLSCWNMLDGSTRHLAYCRLVAFMQKHAVQWRYYELINIPVKDSEERRSRRSSRSSTSTQNVGHHPKPKPPFR